MARHLPYRLRAAAHHRSDSARRGFDSLAPFRTRWHAGELFGATLLLGELGVLAAAPPVGALLLGSTLGLGGVAIRGMRRMKAAEGASGASATPEAEAVDAASGLPGRQQLIDQLSREIARVQRYSHEISIVVVGVAQFEELQTCWGGETAGVAALHVARSLQRVTRASDFVARVDASHFAIVLMQCNGEQARHFGERVSLAVSNRPLTSGSRVRVPLYVSVETTALQYQAERYRGPLDFLSAAGGDVAPLKEQRRKTTTVGSGSSRPLRAGHAPAEPDVRSVMAASSEAGSGRSRIASDPRALRRQLMQDYYPEGKAADFADAYRAERSRAKRAI
jgi:diguanylate cyclase (GGDEF)-like protein